jgi:hypothetical protein
MNGAFDNPFADSRNPFADSPNPIPIGAEPDWLGREAGLACPGML